MTLTNLNRKSAPSSDPRPVKVLQFGEGNFLRAFVDWIIDTLNEEANFNAGVQIVQPLPSGMGDLLNQQDGLYHVLLQGLKDGKPVKEARLITCVNGVINPYRDLQGFMDTARIADIRFIVSNTTESGITFNPTDVLSTSTPDSFPAKLTLWLYERFNFFNGDKSKGLVMLPCELIEKNGEVLKQTILQYIDHWKLSDQFRTWLLENNTFCNTLVDRIVPGFPKEHIQEIQQALGYDDQLVVTAEHFHLWVIEAPDFVREMFPVDQTNLDVVFTKDLTPYRSRKVRILNGAHTAMVPVAYLEGFLTVRESMEDKKIGAFVKETIANEIIPTLDLPIEELKKFAADVTNRFLNPFIRHELLSIALNSISKFEVRVLPSIVTFYDREKRLPLNLVKAFAALLVFYRGHWNNQPIPLSDSEQLLNGFRRAWESSEPASVIRYVVSISKTYEQAFSRIPELAGILESEMKFYLQKETQEVS